MEKLSSRDSDSDYAFRLQMDEVLAASLVSQSRTPYRPPSPPIVARCGYAVVQENDQKGLKPNADLPDMRIKTGGFDFRKAIGEGNSKGKGKIQETVTGVRKDERKPDIRLGNFRNTETRRLSPVIASKETVRLSQSLGEGSSKVNSAAQKFHGHLLYRLYFKGLVSEETGKGKLTELVAGFGVAICDLNDNLLFEMKGPLVDRGTNRQGADVKAMTRGLTEALKLGIKKIAIFCDSYPIFQYVTGKWVAKQKKVSLLLEELHRIRHQFPFSQPVLVAGHDVKFAYKLARESIVSQVTPHEDPRQVKAARKEECAICYSDIDAERMFSVDKCRHRFCFQCVKQHVEVKLLHGMFPRCPHDDCKSELFIDACGKLLTPKLSELWQQRIRENAIPVTDRVYCPYPKCSALMSKTKISESAKSLLSLYPTSGVRRCVECRGLFCVNCKVPWHGKLSCTEYKKLHPNPPAEEAKLKSLANNKMWRQCGKCQHMIELTQGCNHITCRCGHEFCYNCGGGWNKKTRTCIKHCPVWDEAYIMRQDPEPANAGRFNAAPVNAGRFNAAPVNAGRFNAAPVIVGRFNAAPVNAGRFNAAPVYAVPVNVAPVNRARFNAGPVNAAPNNYFDDDDDDDDDDNGGDEDEDDGDDDEDDDYDYEPDEDFNYNDYSLRFGDQMNEVDHEEPFDPFFDLPDGVIFTPDMLSPRSRQRYYFSDDDSDEEESGQSHIPPHNNNAPFGNAATVNAPPECEKYATEYDSDDDSGDDYDEEETDHSHIPHNDNAPFGNAATVNAPREYGKYATVYDSDDDYDEEETGRSHIPPLNNNAPFGNATVNAPPELGNSTVYDSDDYSDEEIGHSRMPPHNNAPFGNAATVNAPPEYGKYATVYDSDDDSDEETGQSQIPHNNNAPFGNAATANAPPAYERDDHDEYFGGYGNYATVYDYDSDGYETDDY